MNGVNLIRSGVIFGNTDERLDQDCWEDGRDRNQEQCQR